MWLDEPGGEGVWLAVHFVIMCRIYQFIGPINRSDTPQFGDLFVHYQSIKGACM